MISTKDRSGYFGASDTKYVMGSWKTKSFEKWWRVKLGIDKETFENKYTLAGTNYEHKIIDSLGIQDIVKDGQVIIEELSLRVNLDANTNNEIYEIKTFNYQKGFKLYKAYEWQVQIQMYAKKIYKAKIVAYGLEEKDYDNYFNEIDKNRIEVHEIKYDKEFIRSYLKRLRYLSQCLKKGKFPNEEDLHWFCG